MNGAVKRAAAGALALAVMSALAGAGTGARPNHPVRRPQPTPGTGSLTSVSCPSASACLAVGGGVAERWKGAT